VALVGIWILPLSATLLLSAAAGFIIGSGLGPVNILSLTVMQERTPDEMLGRVMSLTIASTQLATPLGVLLAGFLIAVAGVRGEMVMIAAGFSAVVMLALLHPVMRTINRPSEAEQLPAASAG
jgi:MFS family permease